MAYLMRPKTEIEIKQMTIAETRKYANDLTREYCNLVGYNDMDRRFMFCHKCGKFMSTNECFYSDTKNASGKFPYCKSCIQLMVEQRTSNKEEPNETKESVQFVLRLMDLPYLNDLYESCIKSTVDAVKERNKTSPFAHYIAIIKSLPQYKTYTWANSQFGDETEENNSVVAVTQEAKEGIMKMKRAKKRFGALPDEDLMFLENEYEDWVNRYECQTKAQEEIFERICFNKLDAYKARKAGKPTKDIDKSLQDLLAAQNIQPRQNAGSMDAMSDAQTFGTLIQKWETTRPIPEVDDDLKDVDKIGLYIDAFYRGHMSKMLDIPNKYSHIYEKVMDKYTVKKRDSGIEDDEANEALFNKIFSNIEDY